MPRRLAGRTADFGSRVGFDRDPQLLGLDVAPDRLAVAMDDERARVDPAGDDKVEGGGVMPALAAAGTAEAGVD